MNNNWKEVNTLGCTQQQLTILSIPRGPKLVLMADATAEK